MKFPERIARELNPPTCPSCGERLEELTFLGDEIVWCAFSIDEKEPFGIYENWDYSGDIRNRQYVCPYCYYQITTDQKSAVNFLRGDI